MPHSPSDAIGPAGAARPYGLLGLAVSLVVILIIAAAIAALALALAFGVAAAELGWQEAFARAVALVPTGGADETAAEKTDVVVGILAYLAQSLAVFAVARFRGGRRWSDLIAWHDWPLRRHLPLLAGLLVLTLVWSLAASAAIEHVYPAAKDWIAAPTDRPWIVGFLALAVLFGPFGEELLFRGWIYTSLRARFGLRVAVLVSSVFFALAHWESTHLYALAVFPVGLALAAVRERTGSIAASITFHALYNGVASVLLFLGR